MTVPTSVDVIISTQVTEEISSSQVTASVPFTEFNSAVATVTDVATDASLWEQIISFFVGLFT